MMYPILLSLAQLTCSAADAQGGIEHARMDGPSLKQAVSLIKVGMSESAVVALVKAAHLPSGKPVRTHREGVDCLVAETDTSWFFFYFKGGVLSEISCRC